MPRGKTGKPAIDRAQKQDEILKLRLTGASYREIELATKIPRSTAQKMAEDAVDAIKRETAEQVVSLELARLDRMLRGIWTDAIDGDVKSIDRALKIMERRAKYLNLDAAVAPDTSGESRAALDALHAAIIESASALATPDELHAITTEALDPEVADRGEDEGDEE
jgi:hypothetical protein